MQFRQLRLFQFKNYLQQEFTFSHKLICITGKNGCGKTTILDALHFLSFTKSYFLHQDQLSVTKDKAGMRIDALVEDQQEHASITCVLRELGKKELLLNNVPYTRFSEHIGKFPCIFICPDDTQLIMEGSEGRRRFLDMACSIVHPGYIAALNKYNKVLLQRNSLLKNWNHTSDQHSLLAVYNNQLALFSEPIFTYRKDVCDVLASYTKLIYNTLSQQSDVIETVYISTLNEQPLEVSLNQNQDKDIFSQRSNYGIHKDDWYFAINGMPMKQAASQGQKKSFLFGIKLALFQLIKDRLHKHAILLLDDFFEKLDEERASYLIDYIVSLNTQVFFTDTHEERVKIAFEKYRNDVQLIKL